MEQRRRGRLKEGVRESVCKGERERGKEKRKRKMIGEEGEKKWGD
jgi:hypothetical protein